jgi:dihydrofolate synthase/folylpolyglutamate synthase
MPSNLEHYTETVNYLYNLQRHGIKLGLENPRRLMSILGEPQKSFRSLHIAGTNGKGSTATIIASILKESGFRVGLFTSPHLVSFTERIRVDNEQITESEVVNLTEEIKSQIPNSKSQILNPTFFEFVTAMAFLYFKRKKVEWAVVETGMGGRLDATNVLIPEMSIITNIGFDHKEFLGETISEIAFEKAGIIKPAVPVITATRHPDALSVLEKISKDCGSELHIYGRDFKSTLISMDEKHIVFDYSSTNPSMAQTFSLPLSGKHQLYNVSLAIRACEILTKRGFNLSEETINKGLLNLNLGGRLEWVSQTPPIIIDSAHNPEAAQALSDAVKEIFLKSKKIILIIGIMKDKDIEGILKPLMQVSDMVILTKPKGERAASLERLKECIKKGEGVRGRVILTTTTVAEAIELAKTLWNRDYIILVTGSFYTTGEAKEYLNQTIGVLSQLRE